MNKHATTTRATTNGAAGSEKHVRKRVSSLKPSPENQLLYRPPSDDPDIGALAESIRRNGCDPLVITADNYIVSGHRRRAALLRIGQGFVRCRVLDRRRDEYTPDEYVALLRDFNEQRDKTVAEQVREELVDIDPDEAHRNLREQRAKSVFTPERNGVEGLHIEGEKKRYNISDDKAEHVRLILEIVEGRRD
jgi:hypothetical protein